MPSRTLILTTSDGCRLGADLEQPIGAPRAAAVVCHPHPLYGGDRHNGVVDAIFGALPTAGVTALRFDFRGVHASTGHHGGGIDEVHDVVAGLDALTDSGVPLFAIGYSFGAAVTLRCDDPRITGWIGIAPPLAMLDAEAGAPSDRRPKHLLVPEHDQFTGPQKAAAAITGWTSTTMSVIANGDHFLAGRTRVVAEQVCETINVWLSAAPGQ